MNPEFLAKVEEAEKGLLGAFAHDPLIVGSKCVQAKLTAEHFSTPERQIMFSAILKRWSDRKPIDAAAIASDLRDAGTLERVGGHSNVFVTLGGYPTAALASEHIHDLVECQAARKLVTLGRRMQAEAYNLSQPTAELLEEVRRELQLVTATPDVEQTSLRHHIRSAIQQLQETSDSSAGIEFGIGLDETAGPFCRGDLIIIAGGTGGGKSALAGNIVENVSAEGLRTAVFSLEMTGPQLAERMIASQGRVNIRDFKLGRRRMGDQITTQQDMEMRRIQEAATTMAKWNVEVIERASTLPQVLAKCRQLNAAGGLDLIVLDYAQLLEGFRDKGDNREREVASISRGMKLIAVELKAVVILLSQLNDDGRLRESRALGQDANTVLFIDNETTIRVGKARSAPSGAEIKVDFEKQFTRFKRAH